MKKKIVISSFIFVTISLLYSCGGSSNVVITFNPLEGSVQGSDKITIKKGTQWKDVNKPTVINPIDYTFSYWTKKYDGSESIPIPETFKFNENTTVYAVYTETPKPITPFNTDSWTNIINYANQGKQAFETKYGSINSLMGQTRKVLLTDGNEQTVKLVASTHDVIASEQNTLGLLTFQFIQNNYSAPRFNNSLGYNSYMSSPIRNSCNNLYNLILDADLKNGIRSVVKRSNSGGFVFTLNESTEKLYVPSYSELNGDSNDTFKDEEAFDYYAINASSRRKQSNNYWTRTASKENNSDAYFVDSQGKLMLNTNPQNNLNISPCFTIGSNSGSKQGFEFYNSSWDDIINNSTEAKGGLEGLKTKFNLSTFIGLTHPIKINGNNYLVRVIGENADFITHNKYSALTFMLTTPYADSSIFSDNDNNGYNNSTIQKFANDLSVNFPTILKDNLNSTRNISLKGNHSTEYEEYYDKISLLSSKELGISSNDPQIVTFPEGYTYSYFDVEDKIDRKYRIDVNDDYYLRSPNVTNSSEALIVKADESMDKTNQLGSYNINPIIPPSLVFKFSIGITPITDTAINFYSNSIYSSNPVKTTKNNEHYKTTLSINSDKKSISEHCEMPDNIKIVVETNKGRNIFLQHQGELTDTKVGYAFNTSSNELKLSTPNQIIKKYSFGEDEFISSIEIVPELEISDTWGEIYQFINAGSAINYYLIGATKELYLNDNTYTIRLLDLNKETSTATNTGTFMFTTALKDSNDELINANYFTSGNYKYKWSESSLKSTYQSYKDDIEASMLTATIQTITKETNYFDYSSMAESSKEITTDETIFSLSYDEVFNNSTKYSYFADSSISNRIIKAQLFDGADESRFLLRDTNKPSDSAKTRYSYANYDSNNQQIYTDIDASSVASIIPTTNLYPCFVL